jgi:hypothetical protein
MIAKGLHAAGTPCVWLTVVFPARCRGSAGATEGTSPGAAASLMIRPGAGMVTVACTNRQVPIEPANARLIRPIA